MSGPVSDLQFGKQCDVDAHRLCKGVEPGGWHVQECLMREWVSE